MTKSNDDGDGDAKSRRGRKGGKGARTDRARAEENTVRQIARTREAIRQKYRALKTGAMEDEIALERRLKPIVEPLQRIAERDVGASTTSDVIAADDDDDEGVTKTSSSPLVKERKLSLEQRAKIARGAKRKRHDATGDDLPSPSGVAASTPRRGESRAASDPPPLRRRRRHSFPSFDRENVFESEDENDNDNDDDDEYDDAIDDATASVETPTRRASRMSRSLEHLHDRMGPLGRHYVTAFFGGDRKREMDGVYGVYLGNEGTMLGDKRFDVDANDYIIIEGVRYPGTRGLFELIFKREPNAAVFTDTDRERYRSVLLATNAHRRGHVSSNPIMGNKGKKYMNIIRPLMGRRRDTSGSVPSSVRLGSGATGISRTSTDSSVASLPTAMRVTNAAIDYVHWDDPNELVNRLQLLDASRRAGNDAHDNEILSIVEELREAGVILN